MSYFLKVIGEYKCHACGNLKNVKIDYLKDMSYSEIFNFLKIKHEEEFDCKHFNPNWETK